MECYFFISVAPEPLKKQPSKESVRSIASSVVSAVSNLNNSTAALEEEKEEETLIQEPVAVAIGSVQLSSSPNLIHRNLSLTSSAGEAGLGRIQLTLRYSVARQKLVVVVHKIAWVKNYSLIRFYISTY